MINDESELLTQIRNRLDLLIQVKLHEISADRNQTDMILLLRSFGCPPIYIAELLGTTTKTVNPVLSRARKETKKK